MKKPSLTDALASKAPPPAPPAPEAAPKAAGAKVTITSLYIPQDDLDRLKLIAIRQRVKVNDLVLQGIAHVLALHGGKS
jgi:hypothetical protein